jgi:uncharacterized protein (DUF2062 family)
MPRRFFRKFAVKRDFLRGQWYLAPFRHLLHDHNLWGIRRRTVVPAVAIGLFVAFMPFPGHPITASLVALAFRVNIPIAALTTFVSNPFTMGPMYYLAHRLGTALLGTGPQPFQFEMSLEWLRQSFAANWQPLMLGCLLLGASLSLVGYVVLDLLWRASLADYVSRRRLRRRHSRDEDR